jgi:hypothetical protein
MPIDDIRRLPDEAFAANDEWPYCSCGRIDRDALRDCIRDQLELSLNPRVTDIGEITWNVVAAIYETFYPPRLKP